MTLPIVQTGPGSQASSAPIDPLHRLGLTDYESRAYTALLEHGRLRAKDIAQHSGVPVTAVYPNLRALSGKGLVQQVRGEEGSVAFYEAIPPSVGLTAYAHRQAEELRSIAKETAPLLELSMHSKRFSPERQVVALSYGSEASGQITGAFITAARKSLHILGWRFRSGKARLLPLRSLFGLSKKGIDVRIIVTGEEHKYKELIKAFVDAKVPIRYYPLDNFSIVVKDGEQCKISLKNCELPEKLNIRIDDPDLSLFLDGYFEAIWKKAGPVGPLLTS